MFLDVRRVIIGEGIFIIGATLVALSFVILPVAPTPLFVLLVLLAVLSGMTQLSLVSPSDLGGWTYQSFL